MHIQQRFNRIAAGLGLHLALGIGTLAAAEPIVPPGANPGYLSRIYQTLTRTSTPTPRTELRASALVHAITAVPENEWLQRLRSLSESEAAQEIKSCFTSFCEHKYPLLSPRDKFIAKLIVIEAMFENGLNDEEFRVYSKFLSSFQPDHDFIKSDDSKMDMAIDLIITNPAYERIKSGLLPAKEINQANAEAQFMMRRNFIDIVTQALRQAHGLDYVQTELDVFPSALNTTAAYMVSNSSHPELETRRAVLFNYNTAGLHNVEMLIELVAHEVRHTIDFDWRSDAHQQKLSAEDPRLKHIAVIHLNQNFYIPLCASTTHASRTCPEQYGWYKQQYTERSARDFGSKFRNRLKERIKAIENGSAPPVPTANVLLPKSINPSQFTVNGTSEKAAFPIPEVIPEELPTETSVETPTETSVETPTETPVEKPAGTPVETPTETSVETPAETRVETPTETPVEKPAGTPVETPTETSVETRVETPTETPVEKPAGTPVETPTEAPGETPSEAPADTPAQQPKQEAPSLMMNYALRRFEPQKFKLPA